MKVTPLANLKLHVDWVITTVATLAAGIFYPYGNSPTIDVDPTMKQIYSLLGNDFTGWFILLAGIFSLTCLLLDLNNPHAKRIMTGMLLGSWTFLSIEYIIFEFQTQGHTTLLIILLLAMIARVLRLTLLDNR